ncbi:hypothetical protein LR48_Vigan03g043700 [Vigna angularis]|uniref:Uncharacterized protein n=1 Tax=Phaseolus angularis TaxID=3914 RepID=A0A0L9U2R0_PHAAN|nr:hypothetical protein LR48_Vigan03g043700 [Vigna angularis]
MCKVFLLKWNEDLRVERLPVSVERSPGSEFRSVLFILHAERSVSPSSGNRTPNRGFFLLLILSSSFSSLILRFSIHCSHLASICNISRVHDGDLNPSLAPLLPQPTNGGGELENEEERTLVLFHNLAKISRPNKNKKRKEGMEVEDGRPWGITISVVEVQRPVEQRRTTNNYGSRCSLLRHDALADELAMLKQVNEFAAKGLSPPRKNGFARCQLWEKDMEIREMKDQIKELVGLLRQSEMKRKEVDKELKVREQANGSTLATPPSRVNFVIFGIASYRFQVP